MPAIAVVAAVTAVVSTGYSIYAGERANSQAKKAQKAEVARNNLASARERRDAIKAARAAQANAAQSAETQGVSMSSAALGGQGSIASQLSGNLSFLDQYKFFSDQASAALGSAATFRARAQTADSIAAIGATVYNNSDRIQNFFQRPATPAAG